MIEEYIIVETIDYRGIENEEISHLVQEVTKKIKAGYEPIGGIVIRPGAQSGAYFLQAMIKREVLLNL